MNKVFLSMGVSKKGDKEQSVFDTPLLWNLIASTHLIIFWHISECVQQL